MRDRHLGPGDRVLVVDDWVRTGAQIRALHDICAARGAEVLGSAVVAVDCPPDVATALRITGLISGADLPS